MWVALGVGTLTLAIGMAVQSLAAALVLRTVFGMARRGYVGGGFWSTIAVLEVTAQTDDGVVMAVEHRTASLAAVQFHPESIMTLADNVGLRLLANVMANLATFEVPSPP